MRLRLAALGGALWLGAAGVAHGDPVIGMVRDVPTRARFAAAANDTGNLPYGGGPVLHANRTHVIFWQPSGSGLSFDSGYEQLIDKFLAEVAAASHDPSNVYGLTGQYTDSLGPATYESTWGGAVIDTDRLPPNGCVEPPVSGPGWTVCLTNSQLQAEIEHVVAVDHLPTTEVDVYFLVTPKGLGSCTDSSSTSCSLGGSVSGYCGYHSETPDGNVLYAVIPYNAVSGHCQSDNPRPNSSTADPALSTISHEHSEMITDPVGDAWIDSAGNEDGDRCITNFSAPIGGAGASAWNEDIAGGHYYLQGEWSNEDHGCRPRDESDQVTFSAWASRSAARARRRTTSRAYRLLARARDPDGRIVSYVWLLGDGAIARGRSVSHTFRRPGTYRVTLKTSDAAGNWAFYTRAISVAVAGAGRGRGASRVPTKSG